MSSWEKIVISERNGREKEKIEYAKIPGLLNSVEIILNYFKKNGLFITKEKEEEYKEIAEEYKQIAITLKATEPVPFAKKVTINLNQTTKHDFVVYKVNCGNIRLCFLLYFFHIQVILYSFWIYYSMLSSITYHREIFNLFLCLRFQLTTYVAAFNEIRAKIFN